MSKGHIKSLETQNQTSDSTVIMVVKKHNFFSLLSHCIGNKIILGCENKKIFVFLEEHNDCVAYYLKICFNAFKLLLTQGFLKK